MTFKEMKHRVEAYEFGPYGRMTFERSTIKGAYCIVFEYETYDVETWKPKMVPFAFPVTMLDFTDSELQQLIEGCWIMMLMHEMKEQMTRYGTKVYKAH